SAVALTITSVTPSRLTRELTSRCVYGTLTGTNSKPVIFIEDRLSRRMQKSSCRHASNFDGDLDQNLLHHAGFENGSQFLLESVLIEDEALIVESQQVKNGGMPVGDADFVVGGLIAELVRCSIGETGFDSAARHPNREATGIVIPARITRIAAELRNGHA